MINLICILSELWPLPLVSRLLPWLPRAATLEEDTEKAREDHQAGSVSMKWKTFRGLLSSLAQQGDKSSFKRFSSRCGCKMCNASRSRAPEPLRSGWCLRQQTSGWAASRKALRFSARTALLYSSAGDNAPRSLPSPWLSCLAAEGTPEMCASHRCCCELANSELGKEMPTVKWKRARLPKSCRVGKELSYSRYSHNCAWKYLGVPPCSPFCHKNNSLECKSSRK